jgi:RNA polymerase sigma-70 factor, ECF subfamily
VGAEHLPDRDPPAPKTLGDLLYTDTTRAPVSEKEWVELVQSIAGGNQRALRMLYDRTHRLVYTLIVRITSNR